MSRQSRRFIIVIITLVLGVVSIGTYWWLIERPKALTVSAGIDAVQKATVNLSDENYYAVLIIPDLNVCLPLYTADNDLTALQEVTDAEYAGVIETNGLTSVAGDHNQQGFNVIQNIILGTQAYLVYPDGTSNKYSCYKTDSRCENQTYDLRDSAGVSIWHQNAEGLTLTTCNGIYEDTYIDENGAIRLSEDGEYPSVTCVFLEKTDK